MLDAQFGIKPIKLASKGAKILPFNNNLPKLSSPIKNINVFNINEVIITPIKQTTTIIRINKNIFNVCFIVDFIKLCLQSQCSSSHISCIDFKEILFFNK